MGDPFAKNEATSAAEAAAISPRAEFRVFGQGVIELVKQKMWNGEDHPLPGPPDAGGNLLPVAPRPTRRT